MLKDTVQVQPLKKDILDFLWEFFSSVRMAIWLLSASAVAILIGTVVEQNQPMEKYVSTYGSVLAHVMQYFDIFDLYHSWWFEGLMSLICLNLILSNFNRAEKIVKRYYHPEVRMNDSYFTGAAVKSQGIFKVSLQEACLKVENALLKSGYVLRKEMGNEVYLYAHRGKVALWGSFVAHIGLLLLFVGVIYGHFPGQGFERDVALLEGGTYYVPERHFTLKLNKFEAQWDKERRPRLYRSTLDVADDNGKTFTQAIEVNTPLNHRGVKVYQATYGPGKILGHYIDTSGISHPFSVLYNEDQMMFFPINPSQGKQWIGVIRHFVPDFSVGPNGEVGSLSKEPVNPACYFMVVTRTDKMPPDPKSIKQIGWLTTQLPASFQGTKIYLDRVSLFSGFQLRSDPGVPFIYTAFIVIILGVCLTFYIHHKVIRARLVTTSEGTEVILVGARRDKEQEYEGDFNAIRKGIGEKQ